MNWPSNPVVLAALLVASGALVLLLRHLSRGGRAARLPYYSREYLLTRGEMAFYRVHTARDGRGQAALRYAKSQAVTGVARSSQPVRHSHAAHTSHRAIPALCLTEPFARPEDTAQQ